MRIEKADRKVLWILVILFVLSFIYFCNQLYSAMHETNLLPQFHDNAWTVMRMHGNGEFLEVTRGRDTMVKETNNGN